MISGVISKLNSLLNSSLSYINDSVTVGKISKGAITKAFDAATGNQRSTVMVDCTGFNCLLVSVSVNGSPSTGAQVAVTTQIPLDGFGTVWGDCYEGSTIMSTGIIKTNRCVLFKGVPDFVYLYLGSYTDGNFTVYCQPINI